MYISHLYQRETPPFDWVIQSNDAHCAGVACLASKYASDFGFGNWGRLLGLLHDRGKEKTDFQNYIKYRSGYSTIPTKWSDKSHSQVGAIILNNSKYSDPFKMLANIIAGHHRGLYDTFELEPLLKNNLPEETDVSVPDLTIDRPTFKLDKDDIHHLARMLYSCLVDADFLDTEAFMHQETSIKRSDNDNVDSLKELLNKHLSSMRRTSSGDINLLRQKIQDQCVNESRCATGFYTLTVPTGGGKTLASVLWAINHAAHNSLKRIIIAIPYTSIIVQTAQVLRNIFGEENVLEHHSVVDESLVSEKNKLATENWDAPIVVTTNVQLFESMFSNRPGKCRKLHSVCKSVVILDEVQTLPLSFLQPVCDALKSYSKMFGTSFLFCTASQPIIDGNRKGLGNAIFKGISPDAIRNLITDDFKLHDRLRRADIIFEDKSFTEKEIASEISMQNKVLCIVNSRKLAKTIFDCLGKDSPENIHLSRMMCPAHIRETIDQIKDTLKNSPRSKIRVVSTQLIEAGVDIDFPIVFRQFSGLDSILQAAGRCNREGRLTCGHTHVFSIEGHSDYGGIRFASDAMKSLLHQRSGSDWFSPEVMTEYYRILYSKTPSFDKDSISDLYSNPKSVSYEEISKRFKLINDAGFTVIVNFKDSPELIDRLRNSGPTISLMRELGLYSVTINKRLFDQFLKMGIVEEVWEGIFYIPLTEQYDHRTGLKTNNEFLEQSYII